MKLHAYLAALNKLSEQDIQAAIAHFNREEIKKGDYYLKEGQYSTKISFVESGLFRLFYLVEGEEKLMLFFSDNQFMADYFGYITQSPSMRPIQALEDSVVYSIDKMKLDQLYAQSKNWERVGRILAESAYITSVLRANRIIHDDPDTRVETFMAEHPHLMQRVPQYMVASYLDMTPETLSRVKRRIMKKGPVKPSVHGDKQTYFLI